MKTLFTTSALVCLAASLLQGNVTINSASFQELTKVTPSGEKVKEWVKASKVVPGTVIRYMNTLNNDGAKSATKLVIKNPIPKNMEYVSNSALCQTGCSVSYSVDGGKSYKKAEALYVGVAQKRHLAKASEYTDIKWVLTRLDANAQSSVEYKARLK